MSERIDTHRRIGIFVLYDEKGIVDDYIEVLLKDMLTVLQELIIVVNGSITDVGYQKLRKITHKIYIRRNIGYDGGAYKDVFVEFLSEEELEQWDEVVLFNDTFYGPFFPWNETFEKMEKEMVDYWGLSRFPEGNYFPNGKEIPEHIQAYFLVCRKPLFLSSAWREFWITLEYPKTYQEAIENFEIRFTQYFSEKGYRNKAFMDQRKVNITNGENPTMWCFETLICNHCFPIIKRKVFCLIHLDVAKKTIDYIRDNTGYNINLITGHLERLYRENRIQPLTPFEPEELYLFYKKHKRIFIYGHGIYGKGIAQYFEYKNWKYDGFIVTENKENNENLLVYHRMRFNLNDGIILALGKLAFQEVYSVVKKDLDEKQLYYPRVFSS